LVCGERKACTSPDDKDASPAQANLFRPRYTYLKAAKLPKVLKPATHRG